jgi:hypothetical protein
MDLSYDDDYQSGPEEMDDYTKRPTPGHTQSNFMNDKDHFEHHNDGRYGDIQPGTEYKYYDTGEDFVLTSQNADLTGGMNDPATINCLSAPAEGVQSENRIGRQIHVEHIKVSGTLTQTGGGSTNNPADAKLYPGSWFIALVLDHQTNLQQCNSEDIFRNPALGNDTIIHCFRDLDYLSRFEILDWKQIQAPCLSAPYTHISGFAYFAQPTSSANFVLQSNRKFTVNFSNQAEGVTSVNDRSLHIVCFQNTGNTGYLSYNSRMRFVG